MSKQTLEIPQHADRCVVLIAHPAHNGDLTEEDSTIAKQAKVANNELVGTLAVRFGPATVHSGESNVSIMAAVKTGYGTLKTLRLLDTPNSHRQARKRARKLLFETSSKQPLVVAYGHHGIINKALGARNVASKSGIKPIAEAAVVFIDKHGQVVGTHRHDLLMPAAA